MHQRQFDLGLRLRMIQSLAGSSGGAQARRTSSRWASLIARIYDVLPRGALDFDQSLRD